MKPMSPKRREYHRGYMKMYRADKKARGECRQCTEPVARRPDGSAMWGCNEHMDADADRVAKRKADAKARMAA